MLSLEFSIHRLYSENIATLPDELKLDAGEMDQYPSPAANLLYLKDKIVALIVYDSQLMEAQPDLGHLSVSRIKLVNDLPKKEQVLAIQAIANNLKQTARTLEYSRIVIKVLNIDEFQKRQLFWYGFKEEPSLNNWCFYVHDLFQSPVDTQSGRERLIPPRAPSPRPRDAMGHTSLSALGTSIPL